MKMDFRRVDLDWLRVGAILSVFIFHSSRFFDTTDWHVKNPATYFEAQVWITFLGNWLMPFVFAISGASLFYALDSRGARKFIADKLRRLAVPLVVGIFSHAALQVYLERITHRQFAGSFFDFIPHYFDGWYGYGGNFAWMGLHLWYLLVLFVYSLLFYPLFRWLVSSGRSILQRIGDFLALPGAVYLLALPIAYLFVTLDPRTDWGQRNFGGWALPTYILFFVSGFIVVAHEDLQKRIVQLRWVSLSISIVCFFALIALWASRGDPPYGTERYAQVFGIFSLSSWCWILTFFGFGFRHFTQRKPILAYANEAILPFYILHQTVLLCIGYFVVPWQIPTLLKWAIIAASSFAIIMLIYEFLVRRSSVMRFLFGMKVLLKAETRSAPAQLSSTK